MGLQGLDRALPERGDFRQSGEIAVVVQHFQAVPNGAGTYVYFQTEKRGVYGDYWELSLSDGTERAVSDFEGRPGEPNFHSISGDGKWLYFTWREDLGDIWVMDVDDGKR